MANEEDSEIDIQIRSIVSHLRELHEKLEEKILKLMEEFDKTTDGERETLKALYETMIEGKEEVREILEDQASFLNPRNRNISPEVKTSRLNLLKECDEKFKNLDLGNLEIQGSDNSGVQEGGGSSNSSWNVADGESNQKDPIFSLDDSDTSKEEETKELNETNAEPYVRRRFLEKVKTSFLSSDESGTDIAGTSVEASSDGQFVSNIDGLVEDLKKLDEEINQIHKSRRN